MGNVSDLYRDRFARSGATFINGTTEYEGKWFAVVVLEDSTKFDSETTYGSKLDGDAFKNATAGSAEAFKQGTIIYGDFTAIKLHTGSVMAYKDNTSTSATSA